MQMCKSTIDVSNNVINKKKNTSHSHFKYFDIWTFSFNLINTKDFILFFFLNKKASGMPNETKQKNKVLYWAFF